MVKTAVALSDIGEVGRNNTVGVDCGELGVAAGSENTGASSGIVDNAARDGAEALVPPTMSHWR